jgi:hypothetical protein
MKRLDKEIREGLCKLYNFDYDGALDAGVIEPEMQIQNLLSAIMPGNNNIAQHGMAGYGKARFGKAGQGEARQDSCFIA